MRAAILHGSNDRYGASRALVGEVRAFERLGHTVTIFVPRPGPLQDMLAVSNSAARVVVRPNLAVLRKARLRDALRWPSLPREALAADLIVLWTLPLCLYTVELRRRGMKFYLSVHELPVDRPAQLLVRTFLGGDWPVQVCSRAVASALMDVGVPAARLTVAYPVVDLHTPARRSLQGAGPDRIAVVGRVNGRKGHLEVAHAVANLRHGGLEISAVFAGAPFPGQEQAQEELLRFVRPRPYLSYVGELSSLDELPTSVSALASFPTVPESFGMVPLEAWSLGIPTVGYGDGGASEVIDLVGGITVPRIDGRDVETIQYAIADMCRRRLEVQQRMRSAADVSTEVSIEARTQNLATLLDSLA